MRAGWLLPLALLAAPRGSGAATCANPATGECTACGACCADLSDAACDACVAGHCGRHVCAPAEACNVCDGCCEPYLTEQRDCDACVNATCVAASTRFSCASHGTADSPLACSQDCLDSCAWTFPPTLSAPCLEKCTVSPLLWFVLIGFVTRVLDYAVDAAWMAVTGTGGEQEQHAGAIRRCLCRLCRCAKYEKLDEDEDAASQLERGASVAASTSAVAERLETMGMLRSAAAERAESLVKQGYTTVGEFEELSREDLEAQGGFAKGDLRKVATFRARGRWRKVAAATAVHRAYHEAHILSRLEPEPEPQSELPTTEEEMIEALWRRYSGGADAMCREQHAHFRNDMGATLTDDEWANVLEELETNEATGIRRANWALRYSKLGRDAKGGWMSMMFNLDRDPAWIEQSEQAEHWQGQLDQYREHQQTRMEPMRPRIEALWRRYSGGAEAMGRQQYAEFGKDMGWGTLTDEQWAKQLEHLETDEATGIRHANFELLYSKHGRDAKEHWEQSEKMEAMRPKIEALWRRYSGGAEAMGREQYAEFEKDMGMGTLTDEQWARELRLLETDEATGIRRANFELWYSKYGGDAEKHWRFMMFHLDREPAWIEQSGQAEYWREQLGPYREQLQKWMEPMRSRIEALWRRYAGGSEAMGREQYAEFGKDIGWGTLTDERWAKELERMEADEVTGIRHANFELIYSKYGGDAGGDWAKSEKMTAMQPKIEALWRRYSGGAEAMGREQHAEEWKDSGVTLTDEEWAEELGRLETDEATGIRHANFELRYSKHDRDAVRQWMLMMFCLDRDSTWIEQSGQADYWQEQLRPYREEQRKRMEAMRPKIDALWTRYSGGVGTMSREQFAEHCKDVDNNPSITDEDWVMVLELLETDEATGIRRANFELIYSKYGEDAEEQWEKSEKMEAMRPKIEALWRRYSGGVEAMGREQYAEYWQHMGMGTLTDEMWAKVLEHLETDEATGIRRATFELDYSKYGEDAVLQWRLMMFRLDRDPAWIERSGQAEYWHELLNGYRADLRKRMEQMMPKIEALWTRYSGGSEAMGHEQYAEFLKDIGMALTDEKWANVLRLLETDAATGIRRAHFELGYSKCGDDAKATWAKSEKMRAMRPKIEALWRRYSGGAEAMGREQFAEYDQDMGSGALTDEMWAQALELLEADEATGIRHANFELGYSKLDLDAEEHWEQSERMAAARPKIEALWWRYLGGVEAMGREQYAEFEKDMGGGTLTDEMWAKVLEHLETDEATGIRHANFELHYSKLDLDAEKHWRAMMAHFRADVAWVEHSGRVDYWRAQFEQYQASFSSFTMEALCSSGSSWTRAAELNGHRRCGALAIGLLRALLWHAVQPVAYFLTFSAYMDELDRAQRFFGWGVVVWEALYLLLVLACTWANPAFLLVDVGASVRDTWFGGFGFLSLYVLAPEKFVAMALFSEGGLGPDLWPYALYGLALLDMCGLGALGAGLGSGNLPPALAVGYSVTALAAFWLPGLATAQIVKENIDAEPEHKLVVKVFLVAAPLAFGVPLLCGLWGEGAGSTSGSL
eukprot:COSAG04_NODE_535_length_12932_cov_12.604223_3_plen_1544_part_00